MADDKRKKKRGRSSKVFRSCFRSFAADEARSSSVHSDGLDSINGRLGQPPVFTGKELVPEVNGHRPPSHRRRFSRMLKSVFDSKKTKKIRRSSSKSSIASDSGESCSSSSEKIKSSDEINACGKECTDLEDYSNLFSSSSRTTLASTSTSSSSSMNSNSRWSSDQTVSSNSSITKKSNPIIITETDSHSLHIKRQDSSSSLPSTTQKINSISKSSSYQKQLSRLDSTTSVSNSSDSNKIKSGSIRWCLFLLFSLVVLVIWGRIFAILCTSISFYFVPCRSLKRVDSVTNAAELIDLDSDQYKKRVIMAGLLERTRNPIR